MQMLGPIFVNVSQPLLLFSEPSEYLPSSHDGKDQGHCEV